MTAAPLDLDTIRTRIPAGYAGPWHVQPTDDGGWLVGYPPPGIPGAGLVATIPDYGYELAEFIAAARTDVPALLAEVEQWRAVYGESALPGALNLMKQRTRQLDEARAEVARLRKVEQAARELLAADRSDDPIRYVRAIEALTAALDTDGPAPHGGGPVVTIERPDDERIEVSVNGVVVASANHDEHGWSGMDAVERTALAVSRALSAGNPDQPETDDASPTTDDIEDLLNEVRIHFADATSDDERAEAIAYLLSEWYGMWPDSAVTSPHGPLAGELLRLLAPWAAKVQQLQGPLAGYALVTTTADATPDEADADVPPNAGSAS